MHKSHLENKKNRFDKVKKKLDNFNFMKILNFNANHYEHITKKCLIYIRLLTISGKMLHYLLNLRIVQGMQELVRAILQVHKLLSFLQTGCTSTNFSMSSSCMMHKLCSIQPIIM